MGALQAGLSNNLVKSFVICSGGWGAEWTKVEWSGASVEKGSKGSWQICQFQSLNI
jgi:hypothetical protein